MKSLTSLVFLQLTFIDVRSVYQSIVFILVTVFMPFTAIGKNTDAEQLRSLFGHFFEPIQQIEISQEQQAKVLLGKTLFYDPRLSNSGQYSCNGCHDLKQYGTNGVYFKELKAQNKTLRDVPSIYNKAGLSLYGWTGRKTSIEAYIEQAITSPYEMANRNLAQVINVINRTQGYKKLILDAFKTEKLTEHTFTESLSVFLSGLLTPAPIDRFMLGDDNALSTEQIQGGLMFDKKYCHSCHTGTQLGGRMIQKMGVKEPWPNQQDLGLYKDTHQTRYKMFFRVSTLRNVEKTAPYFHDGSSKRVWDAVKKMARYELGHEMELKDALSIQTFFTALTGDIPKNYINKPAIPN